MIIFFKYCIVNLSGSTVGTVIGMPLSGILAETALGWKMIFYFTAGLLLVTAFIWFWFSASSPSEHRMISVEEKDYIEIELNAGKKIMVKFILEQAQFWRVVWSTSMTLSIHTITYFLNRNSVNIITPFASFYNLSLLIISAKQADTMARYVPDSSVVGYCCYSLRQWGHFHNVFRWLAHLLGIRNANLFKKCTYCRID